jgi:hypothetical protein
LAFADCGECTFLLFDTSFSSIRHSPIACRRGRRQHYAEYAGTDAGKMAYYMLRWVTTCGEK